MSIDTPSIPPRNPFRLFLYGMLQLLLGVLAGAVLFILAQYAGLTGKSQEAERVSLSHDSFAGHYLSARFAQSVNNIDAATLHYEKALKLDPDNAVIVKRHFLYMLKSGRMEKAMEMAKLMASAKGEPNIGHIAVAADDFVNNKFANAETLLRDLSTRPVPFERRNEITSVVLPLMLAWSLEGQGKYDDALKYINSVTEEALTPFTAYQKAIIFDRSGNKEAAGAIFDAMLKNPAAPYKIVAAAHHFYINAGQKEKASTILERYRAENEEFQGSAEEKLLLQQNISNESAARAGIAEVMLEIAGFLYANGLVDPAIDYLRLSLMLDPESSYAKVLLASSFEKREMLDVANSVYATIPPDSRFYWKTRLATAQNLNQMEQDAQAEKLLKDLAKERPTQYEPLLNLADIYMDSKQYRKAADTYEETLKRINASGGTADAQKHWPVYYALGICYERLGKWEKAEPYFLEALKLKPQQSDVLNYLAYSWLVMGKNYEEAEKMLLTALEDRPDDPHIIDSYGWALYQLGRFEEALPFIERANLMIPYDATTNDHLGDIYWALDRKTEAYYQWERALLFKPEHEDEAKIKKKLKKVGGLPKPVSTSAPAATH